MQNYLRLLALQAARTSDGRLADLELLLREMRAMLAARPPRRSGSVGRLSLGFRVEAARHAKLVGDNGRAMLRVEVALLAARLGRDDAARSALAELSVADLPALPNPLNLVLALGRAGAFDDAATWLAEIRARGAAEESETDQLQRRLSQARALLGPEAPPSGQSSLRRAQGFLLLGAYGRGLAELEPSLRSPAPSAAVGSLAVHLMLAAGLESRAFALAQKNLGAASARAWLDEIQSRMSPALLSLRAPH